jgi:hypothetical protein
MDILKLLRYNTGTDKKLFTEFSNNFDAVIMNATIAAYSGSAMADLVSIYKDKYIIDPQTYILQQDVSTLVSNTSKKGGIKKSISQYLFQLPEIFLSTLSNNQTITTGIIEENLDELVKKVGDFELKYISSFIEKKEYNKYLDFISETEGSSAVGKPCPKMLIAPYFMLKDEYDAKKIATYIKLNNIALEKFISQFASQDYSIAGQIVLEKGILDRINDDQDDFLHALMNAYQSLSIEYIFVWIDDFSPIESESRYSIAFAKLIKALNSIKKKPIMSYGGYDSIILCNTSSPTRLYGVAQSVGYGEKRRITPVGGGLPVNKFYFPPTHHRLKSEDISRILFSMGFFDEKKSLKQRAAEFYSKICSCEQCKYIVRENFENFSQYLDSTPFTMKNGIRRNRPTQNALEISARHFLHCKVEEWENVLNKKFNELTTDYINSINIYCRFYDSDLYSKATLWAETYGK